MYKLCSEILTELEKGGVKINHDFEFPEKQELKIRLKDILDEQVDEKYYLSEERLSHICDWDKRQRENGRGFRFEVKDGDSIGRAVTTSGNRMPKIVASRGRGENNEQHLEPRKDELTNTITSVTKDNYVLEGGVAIKTANKQGYDMANDGDSIDLAYPNSETRRGRVGHGVSKTLATGDTMGTLQNYRIRKLTAKECWRLMSFDDEDFEKAEKVNSNSQLYRQAGNSIVVKVLEEILRNLLINQ